MSPFLTTSWSRELANPTAANGLSNWQEAPEAPGTCQTCHVTLSACSALVQSTASRLLHRLSQDSGLVRSSGTRPGRPHRPHHLAPESCRNGSSPTTSCMIRDGPAERFHLQLHMQANVQVNFAASLHSS